MLQTVDCTSLRAVPGVIEAAEVGGVLTVKLQSWRRT